jgi:hypothetical protein
VDALPVLLHRPIRGPARPESVALVRSAQPVVGGAAISSSANSEPFAIDIEGEQHPSRPSLSSAGHNWNGGTVAVTPWAPVHKSQHPRPPTSSPSHTCSADTLIWQRVERCRGVPPLIDAQIAGHAKRRIARQPPIHDRRRYVRPQTGVIRVAPPQPAPSAFLGQQSNPDAVKRRARSKCGPAPGRADRMDAARRRRGPSVELSLL